MIDDSTIVSVTASDTTRSAKHMTLRNSSGTPVNTPIPPEDIRQRSVMALIYKSADDLDQAGGGSKPTHNTTTTNHAAFKSKHNSSFKASSSKTKGKGHNRSHTQRVK